jgi:H+/Cl- antiporter ClcA
MRFSDDATKTGAYDLLVPLMIGSIISYSIPEFL